MYDTILVPTDGSDVARAALDQAVDIAEQYDATVHALYVADTQAIELSLGTEQVERIRAGHFDEMDELEAQALEATGEVAAAAEERGLASVEHHAGGQPHQVIAHYADDHDIDLVVMGSHGRSGVKRALLGSVTERVLRSTHRPVLVVDWGRAAE